jgi:hypothetical protein
MLEESELDTCVGVLDPVLEFPFAVEDVAKLELLLDVAEVDGVEGVVGFGATGVDFCCQT